jgi:hypothetical protein
MFLPGCHDALKLQLKQWYEKVSPSSITPPRIRVSAPVPLCTQQGALKDNHPEGVIFFFAGM